MEEKKLELSDIYAIVDEIRCESEYLHDLAARVKEELDKINPDDQKSKLRELFINAKLRKKGYKNKGRYTQEEDNLIIKMSIEGKTRQEIARKLDRTERSISTRKWFLTRQMKGDK